MMEMEIEVEKKDAGAMPDISVLDKAFEILKKAGFPQESLDKAYEMLKAHCEEGEKEDEVEVKMDIPMKKKGGYEEAPMPSDMKGMMMQAMKALIERKSM